MYRTLAAFFGISILLAACSSVKPLLPTVQPTYQPSADALAARTTSVPVQGLMPADGWQAYHDERTGFSVQYPATWFESDSGGNPAVFTLVAWMGTTLVNKAMELYVTEEATDCKETAYSDDAPVSPTGIVTVNGISFLRESGRRTTASNIDEWTSYSTKKGSTCINLIFVLHSVAPGSLGNQLRPFDKAAESAIFGQLLNTFQFDH
ncbi:MAG: hypothetical protein ACXVBV_13945 [Isosphaeraceae bacterium]